MQTSADHNASGRVSVELDEPVERTPLLGMTAQQSRLKTWASISVLALVLVGGVLIGVYLLVLQSEAEDIIPPENSAIEVNPQHFDSNEFFVDEYKPKYIVIKAGETHECYEVDECIGVVEEMESNTHPNGDLNPFHVLAMSDGRFMYDRKWNTEKDDTFNIAMIGNYTDEKLPMMDQVRGISNFILYHEKMDNFDPKYIIIVDTDNYQVLHSFRDNPHFCAACRPT